MEVSNQIPEEDRKVLEQEAEDMAIIASEGYCEKNNHCHDCPCSSYELGYTTGATQSSYVKNLTLGLQSAEKEIKRVKGLIELAHHEGYKDGLYQGQGKYSSTESFILFKTENNL